MPALTLCCPDAGGTVFGPEHHVMKQKHIHSWEQIGITVSDTLVGHTGGFLEQLDSPFDRSQSPFAPPQQQCHGSVSKTKLSVTFPVSFGIQCHPRSHRIFLSTLPRRIQPSTTLVQDNVDIDNVDEEVPTIVSLDGSRTCPAGHVCSLERVEHHARKGTITSLERNILKSMSMLITSVCGCEHRHGNRDRLDSQEHRLAAPSWILR